MTGIEIAIIAISAAGLFLSGSIALNVGTMLPERLSYFGSRIKHTYRKSKFKGYQLVSLNSSPRPFAAVCEFLSTGNYRVDTKGKQYLSMVLCNKNYTFNIPETSSDILPQDINILIRIGGNPESNCDSFYIYYDDSGEYQKFIQQIIAPFCKNLDL